MGNKLGVVLVLMLIATLPLAAQGKRKATKKQDAAAIAPVQPLEPAKPVPVYQEASFDPNAFPNGLPPLYQGIGGQDLVKALADLKKGEKKDEYETKDQFQERLTGLDTKPFLRKVGLKDTVAMVCREPLIKRSYDADAGSMMVSLEPQRSLFTVLEPHGFSVPHSMRILLVERDRRVEDATFTNAYGASWKGQDVRDRDVLALLPVHAPMTYRFSLSPADAKAMKDQKLAVLLVGNLKGRAVVESGWSKNATMDDPTHHFSDLNSILFNPSQVWVYVPETGRVLHKKSIEPPPLTKAGIDLGMENMSSPNLSILSPGEFKADYPSSIGTTTAVYTAQTPGIPRVRVVVTETTFHRAPGGPLNLDDYFASYLKGMEKTKAQFADKAFSDLMAAGVAGKGMRARMQVGGMNFEVRSAVISRFNSIKEPTLLAVHIAVDSSLDQAGAEADRILGSLQGTAY
jgi:hypothetical protein